MLLECKLSGRESSECGPACTEKWRGLAIGIGDYHYKELGAPKNAELIKRAADMAREVDREIASPDEVKAFFNMN